MQELILQNKRQAILALLGILLIWVNLWVSKSKNLQSENVQVFANLVDGCYQISAEIDVAVSQGAYLIDPNVKLDVSLLMVAKS